MDKLSEYVPLLIILASIIISFARKGKKKGAETTSLPGREDEYDADEFRPDIHPWDEPEKVQVQEKPVPVKQVHEKIIIPTHFKHAATAKHGNVVSQKAAPAFDWVDEPNDSYIDISDMDEVKKAIVYSEIFNKKY
jgi:hypothetical protein